MFNNYKLHFRMLTEFSEYMQKYKDKKFVFALSGSEWVVVLKKIKGTKTTEKRWGVSDKKYAIFRGNKFFVEDIVNKFDVSQKIDAIVVKKDVEILFKNRSEVEDDKYEKDINMALDKGITFFLSYEPSYYSSLDLTNYTGIYKKWYYSGQLEVCRIYKNGKKHGLLTYWHINGKKSYEVSFVDGLEEGIYTQWYENGMKKLEGDLRKGTPVGEWRSWQVDGTEDIGK